MGDKEINITYETLFELLRIENSREELQKLDKSFFSDVAEYLGEKQQMINKRPQGELFSAGEKEKLEKQLENVKKIIRELYDKREKKIANLAIYKSRTNSDLIDKNSFLEDEHRLFDELVDLFKRFRTDVVVKILNVTEAGDSEKKPEEVDVAEEKGNVGETENRDEKETALVKFLQAVPKFVGKELEVYGPFRPGDTADLPKEIAEVLINKERAEKIEKVI